MSARRKTARKARGLRVVASPAVDVPRDSDGRPTDAVEAAVMNAPPVGNWQNLGDLILKAIAPGIIEDSEHTPAAWEPPEAATLRMLAMELKAIARWIELDGSDDIELPNLLLQLSERADACRVLAWRLREARFGTSPTYGGVLARPLAEPEGGAS